MIRSLTAPRSTARTLLKRVRMVPGASPRGLPAPRSAVCIALTHASTCERSSDRMGTSQNVTDRAARAIARVVPDAQTCRAAHRSKYAPKLTFPAFGST